MIKVFISGPYTQGDVAVNVKRAMDLTNDLINKGFAPFCPHLTHFLHINNPQPYEKWLELDCEYLVLCDCLLRVNGLSEGADKEVDLAKSKGIPVFYSLKDLYDYYS